MSYGRDDHRDLRASYGREKTGRGVTDARRRVRGAMRLLRGFDQMPIRMRLAVVSTALTFAILCGFALIVGGLAAHRIRSDWDHELVDNANGLISGTLTINGNLASSPLLTAGGPLIRILLEDGQVYARSRGVDGALGAPPAPGPSGYQLPATQVINGYEVANLRGTATESINGVPQARGPVLYQYAQPIAQVEATINRVRLLLGLGVVGGTLLALLAGLMIARRAMEPIALLTSTAGEIARTRNPRSHMPLPDTDDEVAELARTLDEMLHSLDAARSETEAMLANQRQFVADASHELRTPLTSVLANLELLADTLHGEQGEAARAALRSSKRMRRLVADLLLLARNDSGRVAIQQPVDLAQIVIEAAAELGPLTAEHELVLDAQPASVSGVRDDLLRMAINLIENALRHTPPGTRVTVHTRAIGGLAAELVVEDDGPGVPEDIAPRLFERFVRGSGDRGGSSGLGLAIVRVVARAHGGDVQLQRPADGAGARFVVRLPLLVRTPEAPQAAGESQADVRSRTGGGARAVAAYEPPPSLDR